MQSLNSHFLRELLLQLPLSCREVVLPGWAAGEDGGRYYPAAAEAATAARLWVDSDEPEPMLVTCWARVPVWRLAVAVDAYGGLTVRAVETGTVVVPIEPERPLCMDGGDAHDWQTVEIAGHGPGTVTLERCSLCGLECETDTWAEDPDSGERRLRVRYVPPRPPLGPALSQEAHHRATEAALSTPPWADRLAAGGGGA